MITFGIDFGTSNSCLAVYDGAVLTVVDPRNDGHPGARVFPSVVAFDLNGEMIAAGWQALNLGMASPHLVVDQMKRWVGKPYDEVITDPRIRKLGYRIVEKDGKAQVQMGGRMHLPEDIITYFLSHVVREGIAWLNKNNVDCGGRISVVVTYPAYYAQNQVDAIRGAVRNIPAQVGEIGFESVRLIPEPTASVCTALYDGRLSRKDRYVMVIDEGAGTLDTLLVDMHQLDIGQMEARGISIGGQAMLGGSDMDTRIMDWITEQMKSEPRVSPDAVRDINIRQLRARVETAKIDISEGRTKIAQVKVPGLFRFVGLTDMHLEALVQPIIDRCEAEINSSLAEIQRKHGIDRKDIGKVILVGGPTRMVPFRKMALRVLPYSDIVDVNPMECVAEGAAVSPAVHYRIPAERTYGLLRKFRKTDTFVRAIDKDALLPHGEIITWLAKAFEEVVIEPAQVLAQSEYETSCLTMGRYTYPAISTDRVYYIMLRLDEERNVYVVLSGSREVAERCRDGGGQEAGGDFRLEFRREVSTRLIQHDLAAQYDEARPDEAKFRRMLREAGFGLLVKISGANEKIEECNRIVAEFGMGSPGVRDLYQLRNETENQVHQIMGKINGMFDATRGAGDTEAYSIIRHAADDILQSDATLYLSLKTEELEKAIGALDLCYDRARIMELISLISDTKNEAWVKVKKCSGKATPEVLGSIESTVGELESIQRFLEQKSLIRANSVDAETFRRGRIKEQELRNKIDNLITQD